MTAPPAGEKVRRPELKTPKTASPRVLSQSARDYPNWRARVTLPLGEASLQPRNFARDTDVLASGIRRLEAAVFLISGDVGTATEQSDISERTRACG